MFLDCAPLLILATNHSRVHVKFRWEHKEDIWWSQQWQEPFMVKAITRGLAQQGQALGKRSRKASRIIGFERVCTYWHMDVLKFISFLILISTDNIIWEFAKFFFFNFFKIYFNWRLITLQYCIGFAIHQHESTTGIHMFPIPIPSPSSLPVPSLWVVPVHQPQATSIMHRTWTGDSFHLWYYICFNAILPNHPTPSPKPPPSPKDCSIHVCLFCCLAYRFIITIFLNSIYICVSILYWCFSFWLT